MVVGGSLIPRPHRVLPFSLLFSCLLPQYYREYMALPYTTEELGCCLVHSPFQRRRYGSQEDIAREIEEVCSSKDRHYTMQSLGTIADRRHLQYESTMLQCRFFWALESHHTQPPSSCCRPIDAEKETQAKGKTLRMRKRDSIVSKPSATY